MKQVFVYIFKAPERNGLTPVLIYCDSNFQTVFLRGAYFRPDFPAFRRKNFAAQYFWFKAKLKQKKFIFK